MALVQNETQATFPGFELEFLSSFPNPLHQAGLRGKEINDSKNIPIMNGVQEFVSDYRNLFRLDKSKRKTEISSNHDDLVHVLVLMLTSV